MVKFCGAVKKNPRERAALEKTLLWLPTLSVSVGALWQLPPLQVRPTGQATQALPAAPQAEVLVPGRQAPLLRQPVQQAAPTQTPPAQAVPAGWGDQALVEVGLAQRWQVLAGSAAPLAWQAPAIRQCPLLVGWLQAPALQTSSVQDRASALQAVPSDRST